MDVELLIVAVMVEVCVSHDSLPGFLLLFALVNALVDAAVAKLRVAVLRTVVLGVVVLLTIVLVVVVTAMLGMITLNLGVAI